MRKITNKFRERKEVIQTANKFEKTKSKQTTVAFLLNFIEEVILICLMQAQIKNSQSVRRDVVKITHSVKLLRRHLILKTQLMLNGIKWFCTLDCFLPKFSWFVPFELVCNQTSGWFVPIPINIHLKYLTCKCVNRYHFCCVQQVSGVKQVR